MRETASVSMVMKYSESRKQGFLPLIVYILYVFKCDNQTLNKL